MYKVYQDPDGISCLEQSHATVVANKTAISIESEEAYKKSIEGLNRQIKDLRKEIRKVVTFCYLYRHKFCYILYSLV